MVRWERPYRGWHKLNTNDSAVGNPGVAGGGGVLRDDADLNINALEINLDAKVVADLMNNSGPSSASNSSIVADCRLLISRFPQVKGKHCYCESNSCADALARLEETKEKQLGERPQMYITCWRSLRDPQSLLIQAFFFEGCE
nr:putative ribonuclease h protein [Quercus suber]